MLSDDSDILADSSAFGTHQLSAWVSKAQQNSMSSKIFAYTNLICSTAVWNVNVVIIRVYLVQGTIVGL